MLQQILNNKMGDLDIIILASVYLIIIGIAVFATYLIVKYLDNKSKKFIYNFIFVLLILGFITHFSKPFFKPYTEMDYPLAKVSFENICAVSVILFPFIYISKSDTLKDYMVILGVISGIISFLIPVIIIQHKLFSYEVFRFYFIHFIIFLGPFLMGRYQIHRIDIRRTMRIPIVLLIVLSIIFINELTITALGWEPRANLFDPSMRNPSLIFGLGEVPSDVPDQFKSLTKILTFTTPDFLKNISYLPKGAYFPLIWMIPPTFIYGIIVSLPVNFYFEKERTVLYFKELREKKLENKNARLLKSS